MGINLTHIYPIQILFMESLDERIQHFVNPLVARIEALEADNKSLKEALDHLKEAATHPKGHGSDSKHTDVNSSKTVFT